MSCCPIDHESNFVNAGINVSMVGGRGGGTGIDAAFELLCIFFVKFLSPLGLEISSYVINYPFLGLTKLPFGAKFVIKYPRKGKKAVFKCPIYACALTLHLNINTCIIF